MTQGKRVRSGVLVSEVSSGTQPIAGAPTGITAVVGEAARGPRNQPVHVQSFADFERNFGRLLVKLELGYAVQQFFLNGGTDAWVVRVAAGATVAQWVAGLQALEAVDLFNLLVLPGIADAEVLAAAVGICRRRRAFLLIDAPAAATTPALMAQAVQSGALPKTSQAATFFPWIKIADPLGAGQVRISPPGGTIAGLMVRTDAARGVWKAAAGPDAGLKGVQELPYAPTNADADQLSPLGVNCLRIFPGTGGPVVWGARTLEDGTDPEWRYIPIRRLALFIEESLNRGLQWVIFEPDGEALWAQIRLSVEAFLLDLWRRGAFQGARPTDAFFVKCDATTITPNDIAAGLVNIVIGFAPLKPAEFIVLRLQQKAVPPVA
jgi:phage tail sheath protein FI